MDLQDHPYALPLDSLLSANRVLHEATTNKDLAAALEKDTAGTLVKKGVRVPEGTKLQAKQMTQDDHVHLLHIPPPNALAELQEKLARENPDAGSDYVAVETAWWGVTFLLSHDATMALRDGEGAIAAVAGAIGGILAFLPPPLDALGLVPATLTAILTLAAAALSFLDYKGNGIYIYAPWALIWAPPLWICWPR